MKDLMLAIQSLFEDVLFLPLDALRTLQDSSWWAANGLNWLFMLIVFVAFVYWMKQLKTFNDNNEENRDTKAHSFLGKDADLS